MRRSMIVVLLVALAAVAGYAEGSYESSARDFYMSQDPSLSLEFDPRYLEDELPNFDWGLIDSRLTMFEEELEKLPWYIPPVDGELVVRPPIECRPCCYACVGPDDAPATCYGLCCTIKSRRGP